MAAKWEYFVEYLHVRNLSTEHLNMRADEGWELVSTGVDSTGDNPYFYLFWRR
jgi:hypothetical protein